MVRRHGWQYPAHMYQVVAITLFFSLTASFYTFLSPFLGHTIKGYVAVGVFSPVASAVIFLYIRCTAIDPSDPGVLKTKGLRDSSKQKQTEKQCTYRHARIISHKELLHSNNRGNLQAERENAAQKQGLKFLGLFNVIKWFTEGDKCAKDVANCMQASQEDILFCTLCEAELSVETVAGLIVLARCFKDKHEIMRHLATKLGNGFTIAPFSALVALCTLAPLLASVPLGELFCFHMLLIRKGLTTYEYVVALRVQSESQASTQVERQYKSAHNVKVPRNNSSVAPFGHLCHPSNKHQDRSSSQTDKRKLPCTVDTESTTIVERTRYLTSKNIVKISALKLAMLNPREAANAARKARESSSILRPVENYSFRVRDEDSNSRCNITPRSSATVAYGPPSGRKESRREAEISLQDTASPRQDKNKSQREAENSRQDTASPRQEINIERSNTSSCSRSPVSAPLSPLPAERRYGNANVLRTPGQHIHMEDLGAARNGLQVCKATILPSSSIDNPSWICTTPMTDGHEASRVSETLQLGRRQVISVETNDKNEKCDSNQTFVYWDRAAGRFRSIPKSNPGMTTSTLFTKTNHGDPGNLSGPHSILSPGRCVESSKPASLQGPYISSTLQNCGKENLLKVANVSSRPMSTHSRIVLPTQSTSLSRFISHVGAGY